LADLQAWRKRFAEGLDQLHAEGVRIDLENDSALPAFYLAYQGRNDRDLQRSLARLHHPGPQPVLPAPRDGHQGKVHVGFLSSYFGNHTIGRLNKGLIAGLSRKDFLVTVFSVGRHDDDIGRFLRQHADRYVPLPAHVPSARRLVAEQQVDILFYPELGMDPVSYGLAFSRLAPVQVVTWGHPTTTGIDTIDYFLSSELLETPGAQEHYTETLVLLKSLPICYDRPVLSEPARQRQDFGLPGDAHLYACLQSLFKLHPEFDELLGRILRRDPCGLVLLLRGRDRHWEELLRRRWTTTLPDVADRIRFLPPQPRPDFLGLSAIADVLLDPIHFGGGNTSYEALAFGVPIVTLPSPYLRGRITLALYRQMGVLDCVAGSSADYVDLAVRLGTDPAHRAEVSAKILAACGVLYDNAAGVRELEQFFKSTIATRS
jgi:predicted O-linked N-acetylglucosamine transferase (SPINDLY family)